MQDAERMGLDATAAIARLNLGRTLFRAGRLDEAGYVVKKALSMFEAQKSARLESAAYAYLSQILFASGDLDGALAAATGAFDAATAPPERAYARAVRAFALLGLERWDEAANEATTAVTILDEMGGIDEGELLIRLAFAKALAATDRKEEAREAIRFAHDRLAARLASIESPDLRASCLERIPEHAEVASLASRWVGLPSPG
jgi:tetratricopeptide (TPR) repeat protein